MILMIVKMQIFGGVAPCTRWDRLLVEALPHLLQSDSECSALYVYLIKDHILSFTKACDLLLIYRVLLHHREARSPVAKTDGPPHC